SPSCRRPPRRPRPCTTGGTRIRRTGSDHAGPALPARAPLTADVRAASMAGTRLQQFSQQSWTDLAGRLTIGHEPYHARSAGADPALRFSPYCWRTRFALAHKGLAVETIPWRFTDRDAIAFSGQYRVPVLQDDGRTVFDSWSIAEYLEETCPAPTLFGGTVGRAHARFVNAWADAVLVGGIAKLIIRDLLDIVDPQDRAYFRASREARFGQTLEEIQAGREERVLAFRDTLTPLRLVLRRQEWLG